MKNLVGKILRKLVENRRLSRLHPDDRKLIADIRHGKLTYLTPGKLASIVETCRFIESKELPGCFIEAGCALGGSSILISRIKRQQRPLYIYDVFEMIPPPTKEDGKDVQSRYKVIRQGKSKGVGADLYYGYETNLYGKVQDNLKEFNVNRERDNVSLIKGLVQDTMQIHQPVAFAHIDVDWYEPVKTCLERIVPKLVVGGSVILDDYYCWSGCRKATDDYFQNRSGQFKWNGSAGSMKVTRLKG